MHSQKKVIFAPRFRTIKSPYPANPASFVFGFLRQSAGLALALVTFEIAVKALVVTIPYVLKLIVDAMTTYARDSAEVSVVLTGLLSLFAAVVVGLELSKRLAGLFAGLLSGNLTAAVRVEMFGYVQHHSHHFFMNRFAGAVANKIVQTSSAVRDVAFNLLVEFIPLMVAFTYAAVLALPMNFGFSVLFMVWLVLFLGVSLLMSPKVSRLVYAYADTRSRFTGRVVDVFTNMYSVRAHARSEHELDGVHGTVDQLVKTYRRFHYMLEIVRAVQGVMVALLLVAAIWLCMDGWKSGNMSVGDVAFLLPASVALAGMAYDLARRMVEFFEQYGTIKEGLEMVAIPHGIDDADKPEAIDVTEGAIHFDNVSFGYSNQGPLVFEGLNIDIRAGEKVGIVGPSGAGKSTLVQLLLRFYDVAKGRIAIDNHDIRNMTQAALRQHISLIPQDISLFHRSIMENIRYGRLDATDEDVIEAAKKAFCHEFIEALPNGYQTIVGERGTRLSGGQRQRVGIARAILRAAPILVLDEASSALDSASEAMIQKALEEVMQGKTVLTVAHRLSTLRHMDRILVFNGGKVIEDGSHTELLAQDGMYARLWRMQSDGFIQDDAV